MRLLKQVNWIALIAFSIMGLSTLAVVADNEDFTFTIPVQLSNLSPTAVEGSILCAAYSSADRTLATRIGRGSTRFTIEDGAYDGAVTVTFNAEEGKDRVDATHYRCSFFLFKEGDPRSFVPSVDANQRWLRAKPNTLIKVREGVID